MKRIQNKLIFCALVALLGLSMSSCKKSPNIPDVALDANLLKSAQKYGKLVSGRDASPGSFEILNVSRIGHTLTISLKGGCKEEDFNVVWDGTIMFSSPGQINLVVYRATEESCDKGDQLDIKVDLVKILGSQSPKNFIINVANGSKKQDVSIGTNGTIVFN